MQYIITNRKQYFRKIGKYSYCSLEEMELPDTVAFDSETNSLVARHGQMFAIQIGTGTNNYLIDLETIPIKSVFPYLDRTLVMHNACFDVGFLIRAGFFPNSVRDTMLASMIYYNGLSMMRHSFGACMMRELELDYDKSEQKNIHKIKLSTDVAIQYCFNDVDQLLRLHDNLLANLAVWGALDSYYLHCRHIVALAYMEQCGLPISSERWRKKMDSDIAERDKAADKVKEYIYDNLPQFRDNQLSLFDSVKKLTVMLSSNQQMIPVFESLGINVIVEDGEVEKKSIEQDVIAKSEHEFAKLWVDYKKIEHDITTYGKNILERVENERLYTSFHPIKDTARLSTRKGGINFLNFPSNDKTRECFYTKNNILVGCDFTAQEAVVLADLSQDEMMLKSVTEGIDLHIEFARKIFPEIKELSNEEILKKHKDKRTASKGPRFALSFGAGAFTLANNLSISLEAAQKIENAYKELHPGIYTWGNKTLDRAIQTGYIESADGFKLRLPDYPEFLKLKTQLDRFSRGDWDKYKLGKQEHLALQLDKYYVIQYKKEYQFYLEERMWISKYFKLRGSYFRLCLNNPCQARAAHQTKMATVLIYEHIIKNNDMYKVKIVNVIHDECVLETPIELAEKYRILLQDCMIEAANHYLETVVMKAEAKIAHSWKELK